MVAVALKPRCSCFREHGVAQRRLNDAPAMFIQASRRDATAGWVSAPWVETHGYRHRLAPRDRIGCSKIELRTPQMDSCLLYLHSAEHSEIK